MYTYTLHARPPTHMEATTSTYHADQLQVELIKRREDAPSARCLQIRFVVGVHLQAQGATEITQHACWSLHNPCPSHHTTHCTRHVQVTTLHTS